MIELAAVYGASTRPGRLALALDTAVESLEASGASLVTRLSLHATPLATADDRALERHDEATQEAVRAIERARAVLFASPVYRASYPGVLKNLFDLLPVESLQAKPVGLIVVGATSHHFLGVDRHLRDVLSWFGALPLPVSVYLTSEDFQEGALTDRARSDLIDLSATLLGFAQATQGMPPGLLPLAARR
jgi:FMN reductase